MYHLALSAVLLVLMAFSAANPSVWPMPSSFTYGIEKLPVHAHGFEFDTSCSSFILRAALDRYQPLCFPWGSPHSAPVGLHRLSIIVANQSDDLPLGVDESYNLTVSDVNSPAVLSSVTVFGALRGLETFCQLVHPVSVDDVTGEASAYELAGAPIAISDSPRFPWRGLLIDTSRHFLPLPTLFRIINTMSFAKFNVFHWHIVDAQSFPIVSRTYPRLSEAASWTPHSVYSFADVRQVVDFAKARGIRVVPEFDTPGHTASWGRGYPFLTANCPKVAADINSVALNPVNETTFRFVENLFAELSSWFDDEYFHVGGDEVDYDCWNEDPQISQYIKDHQWNNTFAFQQYLTRLLDIVGGVNRTAVGWEELFTQGILHPGESAVVHIWKSGWVLHGAVHNGYRVLLSAGWYLDQETPSEEYVYGFESTWRLFYKVEPINATLFTPDEISRVLGGEAAMWAEQVDEDTIDSRIWPRAAAVAERLWSPMSVADVDAATSRLMAFRCLLVARGIRANPILPDFCYRVPLPSVQPADNDSEEGDKDHDKSLGIGIGIGIGIGMAVSALAVVIYVRCKRRKTAYHPVAEK